MIEQILSILIGTLSTIASAVLVPMLVRWLNAKTNNEKIQSAIADLACTVQTSVNMLEQSVVKQLKADGRWNTEAQQSVLDEAIRTVIYNLSLTTRKAIEGNGQDICDVIARHIESQIYRNKIGGKTYETTD